MSLLENLARTWREPVESDDPSGPQLRVVPDRPRRSSRVPFVVLMLGVLGVGLVGLLLLNTSLQQGAFAMHDLQGQAEDLRERQAAMEHRVAQLRAPENLARRAREQGMVPNPNPAFLRIGDGTVLGKAEPATRPSTPPQQQPGQPNERTDTTGGE